MAIKHSRKKQTVNKWRVAVFFFFLLLSLTVLVAVFFPPDGFIQTFGLLLKENFGALVVFVPFFLFLFGAFILRLNFAGNLLKKGSYVFLSCFFLSSMLTVILFRINPSYIFLLGGLLIGRVVFALQDLVGGVISWLILFSLFVSSVAIFTGWDIGSDINSILQRVKKQNLRKKGSMPFINSDKQSNNAFKKEKNPWKNEQKQQEFEPILFPELDTTADLPLENANSAIIKNNPQDDISITNKHSDKKTAFSLFQDFKKPPIDISNTSDKKPYKEPQRDTSKPKSGKSKSLKKGTKLKISGISFSTEDEYNLPSFNFLSYPAEGERQGQTPAEVEGMANLLVSKLADFGVKCTVADSCPGPVLTRYELAPGIGVKVSKILNLSDDLALALKAQRVRILAPIPGKGAVGIEVPNKNPETVYLREIITNFSNEKIPVALGKDIEGHPYIADLTKMPHLLVAGATGSGKSVCIHAILSTILLTRSPYQVRLAMIDPKMLELSAYKGIPHLWAPVVVQANKAKYLLNALVKEMEDRYSHLAGTGVRTIAEYNARFGPNQTDEFLPYIVVVIDELADLMMVAAREIEPPIARLAQMARAVGIHLVVATQRPSVNVITGVIKANFPSRIAFSVGSIVDSRTIIDVKGAEKLLGKGDMLFTHAASPEPIRIHGSFISTTETIALVKHWQEQPKLDFEFEPPDDETGNLYEAGELDYNDPKLEEVKRMVIAQQRASVSMVQRKFRVGYARAGKLIDMLERLGVVGPFVGSKPREVLVKPLSKPVIEEEELSES